MRERPTRRFTIADIMIIVAAAAVGLVLSRLVHSEMTSDPSCLDFPHSGTEEHPPPRS